MIVFYRVLEMRYNPLLLLSGTNLYCLSLTNTNILFPQVLKAVVAKYNAEELLSKR